MATLTGKLIAKAQRAIVAYYHLCTDHDDWGTLDEHWLQVLAESPAPGYLNRYFVRVKNTRRFEHQKNALSDIDRSRGIMCVTFLHGSITPDTGWYIKPSGRHANPLENYQHRDAQEEIATNRPENFGSWA
ncbi:hypothetical protein CNR34_00123 [Pseudomonas phage nickie]|uniref:Uncharacterized protein n=1 Tax=Pseudomonas phage nickie TaxID=2048977 RepID=A0A2H4P7A9_9CAUD|nr:hypothetical protein FDJ16_gp042 [Pseudomonas phage nickie]ATW58056.1 hypothetical protein CNR34_00123 [Pseudomonas phage nickie]